MSQAVCFFLVSAVGTAASADSLGKMLGYGGVHNRAWWVLMGVVTGLTAVNAGFMVYWGLQLG